MDGFDEDDIDAIAEDTGGLHLQLLPDLDPLFTNPVSFAQDTFPSTSEDSTAHKYLAPWVTDASSDEDEDEDEATGETGQDYEYTSLAPNMFRLVQFVGMKKGRISCIMQQFNYYDMSTRPSYCALSYTWGSNVHAQRIFLNGKRFVTGKNLWDFFDTWKPHNWYWIDQISIDQNNTIEKNTQVLAMAEIYAGAQEVSMWLGLAPEAEVSQLFDVADSWLRPRDDPLHSAKLQNALFPVFENRYWTRLWIVQEIILAEFAVLYYGTFQVPWDVFQSLLMRHEAYFQAPKSITSLFISINNDRPRRGGFKTLITDFSSRGCADPRDKIFALRSLGITQRCSSVPVDYRRDAIDVFEDAIALILAESYDDELDNISEFCMKLGKDMIADWPSDRVVCARLALKMVEGVYGNFSNDRNDLAVMRLKQSIHQQIWDNTYFRGESGVDRSQATKDDQSDNRSLRQREIEKDTFMWS